MKKSPLVLIILDGFGYRESTTSNAIAMANTPHWDNYWNTYPHTTLEASGSMVGLPDNQMGNSEVGHLTMGAGRVVDQDLTRIDRAIQNALKENVQQESFFENKILNQALALAIQTHKKIHVLGLLSPGGVHSHEDHIMALLKLAAQKKVPNVIVHPFLDGRDTPPQSAMGSLENLEKYCQDFSNSNASFSIGSICGRYYAMDRDKRYERTEKAYRLLTENAAAFHSPNAVAGLKLAYERQETDEFVQPTRIGENAAIEDGDIVIFMNFRTDRTRQLCYAFTDPNFTGFHRQVFPKITLLTLTEYANDLTANIIFPPIALQNLLGEYLAQHHLKQLRIAETEKYAHVTYFFNGGREEPYYDEERILIPSPRVSTYDLCPEMSAKALTERLIEEIRKNKYDVIICNFANADMVGHSGELNATILSIEVLDQCLKEIIDCLQEIGGEALITADHGNAECMFDEATQQPHTAHTTEKVPFLYIGRPATIIKTDGSLSDIAPTMLYLLNLPKPLEMTGTSLIAFKDSIK